MQLAAAVFAGDALAVLPTSPLPVFVAHPTNAHDARSAHSVFDNETMTNPPQSAVIERSTQKGE
jgi:hypothetical protein